jgi:hypothetical protein
LYKEPDSNGIDRKKRKEGKIAEIEKRKERRDNENGKL